MDKIKIAICGYGNLGKAVEGNIEENKDMELVAIFSRRDSNHLKTKSFVPVVNCKDIEMLKDEIDVVIMCGGSATDLPEQTQVISRMFNTVDSFDTHAKIPEYFEIVNQSAISNNKTATISGGWDPGLFSLMRLYANSVLPNGGTYTFWGKGVSQGHSDAIRRVKGVRDGVQYTIPIEDVVNRVRNGERLNLNTSEKHLRECFVVAEDEANKKEIENEIKNMPNYFSDYHTDVHFISEEELKQNHNKMPHGGFVIHSDETKNGNKQVMEFSLKLDSNPEFTASVLIALARATFRMNQDKMYGAKTIFDIPPVLLSEKSVEELRKELL